MRPIGFSTGSIALGDFQRAAEFLGTLRMEAIELSALRESELAPLLRVLGRLNLSVYRYISFHAPSSIEQLSEAALVDHLAGVVEFNMPVVIHPDLITQYARWRALGSQLLIENMDRRKSAGRTPDELRGIFNELPDARLCFDIGHARQIDPTMSQATTILEQFGPRLAQVHISQVNAFGRHECLNAMAMDAFQRVAGLIPLEIPVIIESPVGVDPEAAAREVRRVIAALDLAERRDFFVSDAQIIARTGDPPTPSRAYA